MISLSRGCPFLIRPFHAHRCRFSPAPLSPHEKAILHFPPKTYILHYLQNHPETRSLNEIVLDIVAEQFQSQKMHPNILPHKLTSCLGHYDTVVRNRLTGWGYKVFGQVPEWYLQLQKRPLLKVLPECGK